MTDLEVQTQCPEPGCAMDAPADPEAHGWLSVPPGVGVDRQDALWWCPMHFPSETRRIHRQEQERDWYEGNVKTREQAIASQEDDKLHAKALARAHGIDKRDPSIKRKLAAIDSRAERAKTDLVVLKRNQAAATRDQETRNQRRELSLQLPGRAPTAAPPPEQPDVPRALEDTRPDWFTEPGPDYY